ncbi:MAG: hypothetical protein GWP91_01995 [Rhodobacterales bacterium]|nr:hypothetical protein [Rhodobacterales bacterium]
MGQASIALDFSAEPADCLDMSNDDHPAPASAWLSPLHRVPHPDPDRWWHHSRPLSALALGRAFVFVGDGLGNITSWHKSTGEDAGTWSAHTARISVLGVADDLLFSGSDDGTSAIWDRTSRSLLAFYRDHPSGIRDLLWDGEFFLTLGRDGRVVVRTIGGGPEGLDVPPVSAFATDQGRLAVATKGEVLVLSDGAPRVLACEEDISSMVLDGETVFAASATALHRWCSQGRHQTVAIPDIVDLSRDRETLVIARSHHLEVVSASTLQHQRYYHGHERPIASVAVDGSGIWSASEDRRVRRWTLQESQTHRPMRHRGPIRAVCADGQVAVAGGRDSGVYSWSIERGTLLDHQQFSTASVEALALCRDTLVAGYSDGTLGMWSRQPATEGVVVQCPSPVTSIVFAGEEAVVGAHDGVVRIYGTDGRCRSSWRAHDDRVRYLAVHADGTLAVASYDGTVSLWREGNCIGRLADHAAAVTRVAFRIDGGLATGSMDETVRVYGPEGSLEHRLPGHQGGVTGLCWTPSGLITAEKAGRIRRWSQGALMGCHQNPDTVSCITRNRDHIVVGGGSGNLWILAEVPTVST